MQAHHNSCNWSIKLLLLLIVSLTVNGDASDLRMNGTNCLLLRILLWNLKHVENSIWIPLSEPWVPLLIFLIIHYKKNPDIFAIYHWNIFRFKFKAFLRWDENNKIKIKQTENVTEASINKNVYCVWQENELYLLYRIQKRGEQN